MKTADVVLVAIGLAGLGLAGFAAFKALTPGADLSQGPRAAAQQPPARTVPLPAAPPPTAVDDLAKDVNGILQVGVTFLDGLNATMDTLGKFADRF